jgi:hypothetical protein
VFTEDEYSRFDKGLTYFEANQPFMNNLQRAKVDRGGGSTPRRVTPENLDSSKPHGMLPHSSKSERKPNSEFPPPRRSTSVKSEPSASELPQRPRKTESSSQRPPNEDRTNAQDDIPEPKPPHSTSDTPRKVSLPDVETGAVVEVTPGVRCRVELVDGPSVFLAPLPQLIVGSLLAFRRPLRDEQQAIHRAEKVRQQSGPVKEDRESQTDQFEFIRQLQRGADSVPAPRPVSSSAVATDDLALSSFRPGDLVQLQSGDVGVVSQTTENGIGLLAEGGSQVTVKISEVSRILRSQTLVRDRLRRKICVWDIIVFGDSTHRVVAMYNDQVFLEANDGQMTCSPANEVTVVLGISGSILEKTVRKILPKTHDYSAPFEVVEVSAKGFLKGQGPDGKGLEKFKFVDHQKTWLFSDEVPDRSPTTSSE